ncbi:hypothetical protein JTE90_017522 [Oedothorax gibbosus]|uniref:AAA+ ATPase domain-containing protein n=1 Tax=Oedothorax gibbosus TaxID=931172 RepID=A0AAV6UD83_9ARAC|nr:hypothetical protein JTE90_017522 [Oedothorax gibbosus]
MFRKRRAVPSCDSLHLLTMTYSIKIEPFKGNKKLPNGPLRENCLALLHSSTIEKLQLKLFSPVLIKTLNGDILLRSWPYDLLEKSSVALPAFSMLKHYVTDKSSIECFTGYVFPADRIVLCSKEYKDFMTSKAFKIFFLDYLDKVYIKKGMILHITYLGHPCCFTIKKVHSNLCEKDNQLPIEEGNVNDSFKISNVNNENDSSILEESFNEKCNINRSFKLEARLQSSTPISSPRVLSQTKTDLQSIQFSDLEAFKTTSVPDTFYTIHKSTKVSFETIPCARTLTLGVKFEDIASLDEQIKYLISSADYLLTPGADTNNKGVFIVGPPGTGKTMLAKALQNKYDKELSVYYVNNNFFRSEESITQLEKIFKDAAENSPCILILDNFDQLEEAENLTNKMKFHKLLMNKISSMIHNLMLSDPYVLLVVTSRNESSMHSTIQKHITLLKELRISIPSAAERKKIFMKILRNFNNNLSTEEISEVSEMAHGFAGADLNRLCDKATEIASQRIDWDHLSISCMDFKKSLGFIKPSCMEELRFEVPNVRWSDIGGMEEVKNAVKEMVDWPLKYSEQFKKLGITPSRGVLMYGPSGCCKTMIAKALATESQLNFIYIKDSKVFSMYVGDSEKSVREVFKRARAAAPCVLFLDEVESLAKIRGSSGGSTSVADRVITQILIEIDGIDVLREGVCVIAATNQPHKIDPSLLRPGRIDSLIYVPLPDVATRKEIFEVILGKKPLSADVDMSYLAEKTEGYTGAEIADICSQACFHAIKEDIASITSVLSMKHLMTSLAATKPRTTSETIDVFKTFKNSKVSEL